MAFSTSAHAANGTWNVITGDGLWQSPGNWENGIVPGSNAGAAGASTDTATFVGTGEIPDNPVGVAVDLDRNIHSLVFSSDTAGFFIGPDPDVAPNTGNTLYLTGGGVAERVTAMTGNNGNISAPVILNGTTYTFRNSSIAGSGLQLSGSVAPSVPGISTLTLDGTHGSQSSSQSELNGNLTDGAGGAILSIVKEGAGTWEVNADSSRPNTYSGDTIINGGILRSSTAGGSDGLGGFSPSSHYIVNAGGTLRNSVTGSTIGKLTINAGGLITVSSSASTVLNVAGIGTGPAVTLNYTSMPNANAIPVNLPLSLTGTTPDEGGLTLLADSGTGRVTVGASTSPFNMGTVRRILDIGKGADTNTDYDLRIQGVVTAPAGFIKRGAGILRFAGPAASDVGGTIEIQAGTFNPSVDNAFASTSPALLLTGGNLHIQGDQTQTFGAVTVNQGDITRGNTASVLAGASYAFNIAAPDSVQVTPMVTDAAAPSSLSKTGAGSVTFTGTLTHTGPTTVSGGVLSLAASMLNTSSLNVTGGVVELRATSAPDRVIKAGAVAVSGTGKIDLKHNKLLTASPVGTFSGGAYTGVSGLVDSARGNAGTPAWDGPTGITTTDSRAQGSNLVSIGVAKIGQVKGIADTETTAFSGQTVLGSDTVAMVTWGGDATLDGKINIDDYGRIDANVSQSGTVFGWYNGDFNYDGAINIDDYGIIDGNIANQGDPFPTEPPPAAAGAAGADVSAGVSAVPEPASLSVLALPALAMLRRRRT